jgi:DNA modification methylase
MIQTYQGNFLEYLLGIPDATFDAVITDFPYNTTQAAWDKKKAVEFSMLLKTWMVELNRVVKNNLIITTSNQPFTTDLINTNRKFWRDELVWDKVRTSGPLNARRRPMRQHETIQIFYAKQPHYTSQMRYGFTPYEQKSSAHHTSTLYGKQTQFTTRSEHGERFPTTILTFPKARGKHPTKKPLELYRWLIRSYTKENDLILDPFGGELTTAAAAHAENRRCVTCELDTKLYADGLAYLKQLNVPYEEHEHRT